MKLYTYKILLVGFILWERRRTESRKRKKNRYLRIRLGSYYGKGGGLNHVKAKKKRYLRIRLGSYYGKGGALNHVKKKTDISGSGWGHTMGKEED